MTFTIFEKQIDVLKKNIPLAVDKFYYENEDKKYTKKFTFVNTINELKELIKEDYNLYEILTHKTRKIYFDIDKIEWTNEETNAFIQKLKKTLNEVLKITLKSEDFVILTNKEDDNNIRSLHIILKNYKMDYKQQKLLCDYLHDKFDIDLDSRVYSVNRQFRMVNQSKINKSKKLIPFSKIETIEDTFINPNKKGKLLTFGLKYDLEQVYTEKPKILIHSTNLIEYVIENLNPSFFNSKSWGIATLCINELELINIEKWCTLSVEMATNKYDYKTNLKYVKDKKIDIKNALNTLYKTFNKFLENHIYHKEHSIVIEAENYLKSLFSNEYENILEYLTDTKSKELNKKFKNDNNDEVVISKNGFIKHQDKIVNIYYDFMELPKEKVEFLSNIEECKVKLNEWLCSNNQLYVLKSAWGTGKTYHIIKEAVLKHLEGNILFITESNALNKAITKQLNTYITEFTGKDENDLFVSHTTDTLLASNNKVVCSLQSIKKIQYNTFDLIIVDEFESICNALQAETTYKGTSPYNSYNIVINLLKNSPKNIFTDADISQDRINLFSKELNTKPFIYKNQQTSFNNTKCIIHTDINKINTKAHKDIENDKKISYVCSTKKDAKKFLDTLKEYNKKVLYVEQDGVFIHENGIETKMDKDMFLTDIEYHIIQNKVDIFIYTPTIKTGISVNSQYFDKTYAISSTYSINYKEFLQMIMRVRITDEINIYIKEKDFKYNHREETIDESNYRQFIDDTLHSEIADLTKSQILEKIDSESPFRFLQIINKNEKNNTKGNLTYNLIKLMKYHKLTYSYEVVDLDLTYNDKEQKNILEEDTKNEWLNIPVMDVRTYLNCRLKEDMKEEFEDKASFYKTKHLFNLFKIEKKILDLLYYYRINEDIVFRYELNNYKILNYLTEATETTFQYHQNYIDDYVERFVQSQIYDNYFKNNDYRRVFNCRRFFQDLTRQVNFLKTNNFTAKENEDLKKACLQEFIYYFDIKCVGENTIMTNKQFKTILIEKMGKSVLNLIFNRTIKNVEEFNFSNKVHFNYILKYVRECFNSICYKIEYNNKSHQSKDNDKFTIFLDKEKINYKKQIEVETLDKKHNHLKNQYTHLKIKPTTITKARVEKVLQSIKNNNHRITKKELEIVRDYLLKEGGYTNDNPNLYFNKYLQENKIDLKSLIKKNNEFFTIETIYDTNRNKVVINIPVSIKEQVVFNDFEVNKRTIIRLYNINQIKLNITHVGYVKDFREFIQYVIETYNKEYKHDYELLNDYEILCVINGSNKELTNTDAVLNIRTLLKDTMDKLQIDENAVKWLSFNKSIKNELIKPLYIANF